MVEHTRMCAAWLGAIVALHCHPLEPAPGGDHLRRPGAHDLPVDRIYVTAKGLRTGTWIMRTQPPSLSTAPRRSILVLDTP